MGLDPKRYEAVEEKADSLMDKLKASGFTAVILAGIALIVLGLLVAVVV